MAFVVPAMPIEFHAWTNGDDPLTDPPRVTDFCNLAWGKRVSSYQGEIGTPNEPVMTLLCLALTDIRGPQNSGGADVIECPKDSGRFYTCLGVDDIGKGFPNEHRAAILAWTTDFGAWPSPIP